MTFRVCVAIDLCRWLALSLSIRSLSIHFLTATTQLDVWSGDIVCQRVVCVCAFSKCMRCTVKFKTHSHIHVMTQCTCRLETMTGLNLGFLVLQSWLAFGLGHHGNLRCRVNLLWSKDQNMTNQNPEKCESSFIQDPNRDKRGYNKTINNIISLISYFL